MSDTEAVGPRKGLDRFSQTSMAYLMQDRQATSYLNLTLWEGKIAEVS